MLTLVPGQNLPTLGSNKLIYFDCSCGKTNILKRWKYFVSGHTKSCGECNLILAEQWKKKKFGKLRMKLPIDIHRNSNKKVTWSCDCGNESDIVIASVTDGSTLSCGKCNLLLKSHWENTKYGSLKMKDPIDIHKNSHERVTWICDCGNETQISVNNVTNRRQKTCGKCNVLNADYWREMKFGRLRMKNPIDIHSKSDREVTWICDCGNETNTKVIYVTNGDTKTCGKCNSKVQKTYKLNQKKILKLKPPIQPEQISDLITALEPITHTQRAFMAICPSCKNEYKPMWQNVRRGVSITCGCSTNRISGIQQEIADFIKSLGFLVELEFEIENLKYDIYVSSRRIVIEYNGLKWHSMPYSKEKDVHKYELATKHGYDYIMIYEDEWLFGRSKVKNLLTNKLKFNNFIALRPFECRICLIDYKKADLFYDRFHYIGAIRTKVNYGVFHEDQLIACISFKYPTRQTSKYQWELARMASDPKFRIHGIWSKLLGRFIKDYAPKSIVSFSDNRLFSGKVYEKMGFKFDGEIPPDYYWVKGQKRYHKSALRKNKEEKLSGKTETELREAQGYRKIWDLGKKRWVLELNH
jgi:ribosomal protein L31